MLRVADVRLDVRVCAPSLERLSRMARVKSDSDVDVEAGTRRDLMLKCREISLSELSSAPTRTAAKYATPDVRNKFPEAPAARKGQSATRDVISSSPLLRLFVTFR